MVLTSFPTWPEFGAALRRLRRKARLTQVELGERLTLSPAVISLHERGHQPIDMERVFSWCAACGCTCRFECPDETNPGDSP